MAETEAKGENGNAVATSTENTAMDKKIVRQIEYYFGDCSLPRDTFLQDEIKKDDGWVTLETMTKFKRLAAITEDITVLGEAMAKATGGLIQVNDDKTKIRRDPAKPVAEFNKEVRDAMAIRTIYAKGFPIDATLDELEEFFDTFGKVEQVFMRRFKPSAKTPVENNFKGSVFVQFATEEEAKAFMAKETVQYKDTDLVRFTKTAYLKHKADEISASKELKKQEKQKKEQGRSADLKGMMRKNSVLFMANLPSDSKFEDLKEFWNKYGTVKFVDYKTGQVKGHVRFEGEDSAQPALDDAKKEMEDKIVYRETELEVKLLQGDEELAYWKACLSPENTVQKNAVLLMNNLPSDSEMRAIKEFWGKHGPVSYVEYNTGSVKGNVRFEGDDSAMPALDAAKKANDGKVVFNDAELEVTLLQGEEEAAYWNASSRKRSAGRGGRGGPRNKRGRFRR